MFNIFNELQEIMDNFNNKLEVISLKILDVKNTVIEIKNLLDG